VNAVEIGMAKWRYIWEVCGTDSSVLSENLIEPTTISDIMLKGNEISTMQ
jgi:hypothetical protein